MKESEAGLVDQYIKDIDVLSVKANAGKDVQQEIADTVNAAAKHFGIVVSSTELGNLKWMAGQLKLRETTAHESQPKVRETYSIALRIVQEIIESKCSDS